MAAYYALLGRSIHFEENTTGTIEIVGVRVTPELSADDDKFIYADQFPMLYIYKAFEYLLPGNISQIYVAHYERELRTAKTNLGRSNAIGQIIPMEI